jgi:hypothetical protein
MMLTKGRTGNTLSIAYAIVRDFASAFAACNRASFLARRMFASEIRSLRDSPSRRSHRLLCLRSSPGKACAGGLGFNRLERQQVLHQIILFLIGQPQVEASIIVIDDIQQSRKATVVEEPAFLMRP